VPTRLRHSNALAATAPARNWAKAVLAREVHKDRIVCQSRAPNSNAPLDSTVTYGLSDGKKP
jgi:hypothetical protein